MCESQASSEPAKEVTATRSVSEARALVPYRPPLDFALQWRYVDLRRQVKIQRAKYQKVRKQVLQISNLYFSQFEDLQKTVKRLRQEIRLVSRGTPLTVEQSSATDNAYFSSGTEQLYNTQQMLTKDAVRKLWKLTNPDKYPERRHLYDAVNVAYDLQDLGYLIELYLVLTEESNLWWRQTAGIAYVEQELERPIVSLKILRSTPEFAVMRWHIVNKPERAKSIAEARLRDLAVSLNNELLYIINPKEFNHGSPESSNEDCEGESSGLDQNGKEDGKDDSGVT